MNRVLQDLAPCGLDSHEPQIEPEYVWGSKSDGLVFSLAKTLELSFSMVAYPDEQTARAVSERYGNAGCIYVREVPLGFAISLAHSKGRRLVLLDVGLNILKEWPL